LQLEKRGFSFGKAINKEGKTSPSLRKRKNEKKKGWEVNGERQTSPTILKGFSGRGEPPGEKKKSFFDLAERRGGGTTDRTSYLWINPGIKKN